MKKPNNTYKNYGKNWTMTNPKLTIQEIALLKQNPLQYLKTHDGTSLGKIRPPLDNIAPKIRNKKKEQAYILTENGEIIRHKRGTKNGVIIDDKTLIDENRKNLHLTHNHPSELTIDNIPTTLSTEDMEGLIMKNNNGEYLFRSISAEAPNGTRVTLLHNNKFNESNEADFHKAMTNYHTKCFQYKGLILLKTKKAMFDKVQQYKFDHPHESIPHMKMEIETRKQVIKEMGSLENYLQKEGVMKDFEDCNCKLRITNNKVDWESEIL